MVKKEDAYQMYRSVDDQEIETILKKYSEVLERETVPEENTFSRNVLKLLIIPEDATEKEHAQNLSDIAEECYKSNATMQGDVFHSAARKVCKKNNINWKEVR